MKRRSQKIKELYLLIFWSSLSFSIKFSPLYLRLKFAFVESLFEQKVAFLNFPRPAKKFSRASDCSTSLFFTCQPPTLVPSYWGCFEFPDFFTQKSIVYVSAILFNLIDNKSFFLCYGLMPTLFGNYSFAYQYIF